MPLSFMDSLIVLQDSQTRVSVKVSDSLNALIDPHRLILTVTNISGQIVFNDIWPSPSNRIVRAALGQFYVDFGTPIGSLQALANVGSTVISVENVNPETTLSLPTTGTVTLDPGLPGLEEKATYTSASLTGGTGTFNLQAPTAIAHSLGAMFIGPYRETTELQDYLFNWQVQLTPGDPLVSSIQKLRVISPVAASYIPDLRTIIDKSRKLVNPLEDCFLGYTDAQLYGFLELGLTNINAYQPSLIFTSINMFPAQYRFILVDAALVSGVMSQELFAVDTDIPNYSDNGSSFVITHQQQLAAFLNATIQRLNKMVPEMKLQLLQTGSLHTQIGPNFRFNQIISAGPNGAGFRGITFKW